MVHITIQQENAFQSNNEIPPHTENLHPTQTTISVGMDMGGGGRTVIHCWSTFLFLKNQMNILQNPRIEFPNNQQISTLGI